MTILYQELLGIDSIIVLDELYLLQGQIISLTGLLARVSLKQLKMEFYWLMLPAEISNYMFTKAINLLV